MFRTLSMFYIFLQVVRCTQPPLRSSDLRCKLVVWNTQENGVTCSIKKTPNNHEVIRLGHPLYGWQQFGSVVSHILAAASKERSPRGLPLDIGLANKLHITSLFGHDPFGRLHLYLG